MANAQRKATNKTARFMGTSVMQLRSDAENKLQRLVQDRH